MIKSTSTDAEIRKYTGVGSHLFAVALHRLTGWRLITVVDEAMPWWENESDPTDFIPQPRHILCRDRRGMYWDVEGVRDALEVFEAWESSAEVCSLDLTVANEEELRMYVGNWAVESGPLVDRPLDEYSEDDLVAAVVVVEKVFSQIAKFPTDAESQDKERRAPDTYPFII